ncbi:MAG: hypothetical protein PHC61_15365, partial [Chitinivibrionales bacterium]|nr:hypothetical protein [Chitinivibrionales bacterium]
VGARFGAVTVTLPDHPTQVRIAPPGAANARAYRLKPVARIGSRGAFVNNIPKQSAIFRLNGEVVPSNFSRTSADGLYFLYQDKEQR